jgi:cytochrome P450
MTREATDFIPAMPRVPAQSWRWLPALILGRGDILRAFTAEAYRRQVIPLRLPGRGLFIVNHPDVVRHVFVANAANYERKSWFMEQALRPVVGDSLFINHGEVWSERRAVIAPVLHPSRIASFHPLFVEAAEELAEDLARAAPGPVDVAPLLATATTRVMMLALFGNAVPRAAAAAVAAAFAAYQSAAESVDLGYLLGLPAWLAGRQNRRARAAAAHLRALIRAVIAAAPDPAPPLFAAMRDARRADGTPVMDAAALENEVAMMLLAGSETSATALTWAAYLIAAHPPAEAEILSELVRLPPGPPTAEAAATLMYTRAVLQEAMRLYPPVAVLSRQAAAPDRIRRFEVKAGDTVMAVPWLLHRHAMWWDQPHAFRPERFLPEAARRQPKFTYIPFGVGPRICAGAAFGMAEMPVFLATMLRRFRLRLPAGWAPVPQCRLTLRPKDGMRLLIEPR